MIRVTKIFTSTKAMIFFQYDQIMVILIRNFPYLYLGSNCQATSMCFVSGKVIWFKLVTLCLTWSQGCMKDKPKFWKSQPKITVKYNSL